MSVSPPEGGARGGSHTSWAWRTSVTMARQSVAAAGSSPAVLARASSCWSMSSWSASWLRVSDNQPGISPAQSTLRTSRRVSSSLSRRLADRPSAVRRASTAVVRARSNSPAIICRSTINLSAIARSARFVSSACRYSRTASSVADTAVPSSASVRRSSRKLNGRRSARSSPSMRELDPMGLVRTTIVEQRGEGRTWLPLPTVALGPPGTFAGQDQSGGRRSVLD